MAKPYVHAMSSARRHGGVMEDYLDIHDFMDSSKGAIADNRHRALTHNAWFISTVIERVFGPTRKNSEGKVYSTRLIAEEHVLEDFRGKYIPSAQDFLQEIEPKDWMDNGRGTPPSAARYVSARAQGLKEVVDVVSQVK